MSAGRMLPQLISGIIIGIASAAVVITSGPAPHPSGTVPSSPRVGVTVPSTPRAAVSLSPARTGLPFLPPVRSTPPTVMPDGVPVAQVGGLVLDDTGAQVSSSWGTGTWCTGGTITVSGTDAVLDDGGSCVALQSPGTYGAGIYQATIYTADMTGHPAFWLTGLGQAWYTNGEIDAAENLGGCWSITYHADGAGNTDGPWCQTATAGWHTITVVRHRDGSVDIYYDGVLECGVSCTDTLTGTDMSGDVPARLTIMFDTSRGNPLTVGSLTVWHVTD